MADTKSWSRLGGSKSSFDQMLAGFAAVDVMNIDVYELTDEFINNFYNGEHKATEIYNAITKGESQVQVEKLTHLCKLNYLKASNVQMEGPTKEVTGGWNNKSLLKYGKTATMEITNALGQADALEAFNGAVIEHFGTEDTPDTDDFKKEGKSHIIHVTDSFSGPKLLVGETYFVQQSTGEQIKVKIIFWNFVSNDVFNLSLSPDGDATTFDCSGTLNVAEIAVGKEGATTGTDIVPVKEFFSILPADDITA
jgi:hypothetical protein